MEILNEEQRNGNEIPMSMRRPLLILSRFHLLSENKLKADFPLIIFGLSLMSLIIIALQQLMIIRDVSDFVRNLETISAFGMVIGKVVVVKCGKSNFLNLFERTRLFCNTNKWKQLDPIARIILRLQKIYFLFLFSTAVLVSVSPYLENSPPVGTWKPERGIIYVFYSFILIPVSIIFCAFVTCAIDCMFLALCGEIIMQLRIICRSLEQLVIDDDGLYKAENDRLANLKVCIQHHNLILRFIKELQYTFSFICLIQYLTGSFICAELYTAFESRSLMRRARHIVTFLYITIQLCFYCIPIDYIEVEALAISDAAYFSDWCSQHILSLKIPIMLMIQNSQNRISIKAGGLIKMNATTVVNVLKVVWSICSIMRSLRKD